MNSEQLESLHRVLAEVAAERRRQHTKWGEQNHMSFPPTEELGSKEDIVQMAAEAKEMTDEAAKKGELSFALIFVEEMAESFAEFDDPIKLREELVQVAAVTVAWIEKIDRDNK